MLLQLRFQPLVELAQELRESRPVAARILHKHFLYFQREACLPSSASSSRSAVRTSPHSSRVTSMKEK